MHVLKKNKQKVTPEAINQMVSNIALRNKIKNPDLIFPGQKLVLEYEREVTANLDAVLKDPEKTQNQSLSIRDKDNSENLSLAQTKSSEKPIRISSFICTGIYSTLQKRKPLSFGKNVRACSRQRIYTD